MGVFVVSEKGNPSRRVALESIADGERCELEHVYTRAIECCLEHVLTRAIECVK